MSQQFFSNFHRPRSAPVLCDELKSILSERMASVVAEKDSFFTSSSSTDSATTVDEIQAEKILRKKSSFSLADCSEDCLPRTSSHRSLEDLLYVPMAKSSIHGRIYVRKVSTAHMESDQF